mmetsp:Transcript_599/g.1599  ORF Transcript_599/g.1599 Transcript_599/m.1599 type:complete len:291 (-) Transcript_599:112-984(-)
MVSPARTWWLPSAWRTSRWAARTSSSSGASRCAALTRVRGPPTRWWGKYSSDTQGGWVWRSPRGSICTGRGTRRSTFPCRPRSASKISREPLRSMPERRRSAGGGSSSRRNRTLSPASTLPWARAASPTSRPSPPSGTSSRIWLTRRSYRPSSGRVRCLSTYQSRDANWSPRWRSPPPPRGPTGAAARRRERARPPHCSSIACVCRPTRPPTPSSSAPLSRKCSTTPSPTTRRPATGSLPRTYRSRGRTRLSFGPSAGTPASSSLSTPSARAFQTFTLRFATFSVRAPTL